MRIQLKEGFRLTSNFVLTRAPGLLRDVDAEMIEAFAETWTQALDSDFCNYNHRKRDVLRWLRRGFTVAFCPAKG